MNDDKNLIVDETHTVSDTTNLVSRMAKANELAKDPEVIKEVYKYGKVPVVYLPTKSMARQSATPGLMEFIKQATTVKEVKNLLDRGQKEYKNVHPGTIRKWVKLASKRISTLEVRPIKNLKKS